MKKNGILLLFFVFISISAQIRYNYVEYISSIGDDKFAEYLAYSEEETYYFGYGKQWYESEKTETDIMFPSIQTMG